MAQRIVALVQSCNKCPHCIGGNRPECDLVDEIIIDRTTIAPFCPLTMYPSGTIASMDWTIRTLREPNKYGLSLAILSHVATKLGTTLSILGSVGISLKDGTTVYLRYDYITYLTITEIHFMYGGGTYKLYPDSNPPRLFEQVKREGVEEPQWHQLELA